MDIYNLITEVAKWVGWPIITIILLLGGGYVFWVLNQRIDGLKEINGWLEAKAKDAESYSPSALVERLATRHKILTEELEKLHADYKSEKQKIDELEAEKKRRIDELEAQKDKVAEELDRIAAQLHTFRVGEVNEMATFFDSWYSQKGTLSIFCSDLEWLAGASHNRIVEALQDKGSRLNLYLKDTRHEIVKKLAASGASVYHIKPEIRSSHRFSILDSNDSKSIIIRNKKVEEDGITFEEYKNQSALVNLALDMLESCYDEKL